MNSLKSIILFLLFCPAAVIAQDSLNMSVLFHWDDPTIPDGPLYSLNYNEIWGVEMNGREYAIIGSTTGTHIFDVTDPGNSTQIQFIPGAESEVIHRDYHDYNGYLYMVCDEGNGTLQIADLSYLPNPAPIVYDSDSLFSTTHNIFIDTLNGILYNTNGGVYSLADPENPTEIANLNLSVMFDHGHDLFVRDDTVFWHAGPHGMHIYDYSTDVSNPSFLSSIELNGYNHSGWLSNDGSIYAFAEETYGTDIQICDVSDISTINIVASINSGGGSTSIPHNLIFKDNYLFISYYHDGVYIFDLTTPTAPVLVGFYDTEPNFAPTFSWHGAWGVYPFLPSGNILVSDTKNGLFVLDVSEAVTSLPELTSQTKQLVKTVDITGREVPLKPNSVQFHLFNDGSVERVMVVD